jgi:hypothetical protein
MTRKKTQHIKIKKTILSLILSNRFIDIQTTLINM